jgi:hypothetical protein
VSTGLGRITPAGAITEFSSNLNSGSNLGDIVAGPDGNLWFTDTGSTRAVGRITPAGAITEFSSGLNSGKSPFSIVAGADGNLWFVDGSMSAGVIGRITPAGAINQFSSGLNSGGNPDFIVAGPDGNLWFTDGGSTPAIGKVALQLAPAATTGAASAVTTSSATVSGSVNPLGAATSVMFRYGTTPAYGSMVAVGSLAASGSASTVTTALARLPAGTLIYYQVVATNAFGTTSGGPQTFKTAAAPPPPGVTSASESNKSWRPGNTRATFTRKHKPPIGTTFSFKLNEPARVSFAFTQRVGAREVKGKCVAQTKNNHHKPACKRTVTHGTLTFTAHAGMNKVVFQGRISASKKLKLGRYTLVITATNAAGQSSKPRSLSFTIVK